MKQINIYGDNYNAKTSKVREDCRLFMVRDGKILISYENKNNQLMLSSGGLDNNESLEGSLNIFKEYNKYSKVDKHLN